MKICFNLIFALNHNPYRLYNSKKFVQDQIGTKYPYLATFQDLISSLRLWHYSLDSCQKYCPKGIHYICKVFPTLEDRTHAQPPSLEQKQNSIFCQKSRGRIFVQKKIQSILRLEIDCWRYSEANSIIPTH